MPYYNDFDEIDDDMDPGPACRECGAEDIDDCNCEKDHTYRRGCPKCHQMMSRCSCELDGPEDLIDGVGFADPGGNSALRAATCFNPRDRPCPTCHRPNMLTRIDVRRHYQCDYCADATERGDDSNLYDCGGAKAGCIICKERANEEGEED